MAKRDDGSAQRRKAQQREVLDVSTRPVATQDDRSAQRHSGSSLPEAKTAATGNSEESVMEYSLENLSRTIKLPARGELSWWPGENLERPWKGVRLAIRAFRGTQSEKQSRQRIPGTGKRFFRNRITIQIPGGDSVIARGDGFTPEQAKHVAHLHALAKLRDEGLLTVSDMTTDAEIEDEKEGMLDVYNYAARYRCIPSVSVRREKGFGCVNIDMPEHDISVAIKSVGEIARAETAAALEFKRQAELFHLKRRGDTVVVKDRHTLSTNNATDFFLFCRDHGERLGTFQVDTHLVREIWRGRFFFKNPDLDPEIEVRTRNKAHTVKIANLVGAVWVIRKNPHLLLEFSQALRAGNGKYIPQVRARDVVLQPEVLQELDAIRALEWPDSTVQGPSSAAQAKNEPFRESRRRHALAPEELARKSSELQKKMDDYKTRGDLEHLRQVRSDLPMTQYASRVRQIVHDNVYCVIIGATGSGKTTQVPQILLDQAIESGTGASCNVICTQPRRIAATSVARRVADERAERLQDTVGYQVRFDARLPKPGGSILYCTAGILLQQLQHAPDDVFDHATHLVIDEVHERDLINDFLLITLKYSMAARAAQGKKLPRIVLMSATIDAEQFATYFRDSLPSEKSTDCPTLSVPGRTFPVKEYYLDDVLGAIEGRYGQDGRKLLQANKSTADYLRVEKGGMGGASGDSDTSSKPVIDWKSDAATAGGEDAFHANKDDALVPVGLAAATVAHIASTSETGAILVFLPGMEEIEDVKNLLCLESPLGIDFNDAQRFQIIMLHSSIQDSQKTVFDPVPEGCRKIILSTNIAETSVTIPDVQFVVDTGKSREKRYDQDRRITQLQCTWISKSNAKQRAGRAGRVQDGVYYALFTRSRRESMRAVGLPELLRSDLQETCLDVKMQALKMPVADFLAAAIEPPSPAAVDTALENLVSLGALTEEEDLTPLGRVLASLPVHPSLGKMIVLGIIFRCLDPMITLGAAASQRPLFINPLSERSTIDRIRKQFAGPSGSDHIMLLRAFDKARQATARGGLEAYNMFGQNYIHRGAFKNIDLTARDIVDILTKAGLLESQQVETTLQYGGRKMNQNSGSEALVKALLVAGLYPNIGLRTRPRMFQTAGEKGAKLHPSSVNDGKPELVTYNSLSLSSDGNMMYLREISPITPLMALLFGGPLSQSGPILKMDQWLPMFIKGAAPGFEPDARDGRGLVADRVLFLRRLLDGMLADAFEDLASQEPLSEGRMREELAFRLARVLNREAGVRGNLRPDPMRGPDRGRELDWKDLDWEMKPDRERKPHRERKPPVGDQKTRAPRSGAGAGNGAAIKPRPRPFGTTIQPRSRYGSSWTPRTAARRNIKV